MVFVDLIRPRALDIPPKNKVLHMRLKDKTITLRCTTDEFNRITKLAENHSSKSEYILFCALPKD